MEENVAPRQLIWLHRIVLNRTAAPGVQGPGTVNSASAGTSCWQMWQLWADVIRLDDDKQYPHLISEILK